MRINTQEELQELISSMDKERAEIIDHIHSIMWNMRGSLSRNDAWALSNEERKSILKQIETRVKAIEKTNLPLL